MIIATFLKLAMIVLGGGFVVTQLILPPFIDKPFFWLFKSKEKVEQDPEPESNLKPTKEDLARILSDAKSKLDNYKNEFNETLTENKKEAADLEELISKTEAELNKFSNKQ